MRNPSCSCVRSSGTQALLTLCVPKLDCPKFSSLPTYRESVAPFKIHVSKQLDRHLFLAIMKKSLKTQGIFPVWIRTVFHVSLMEEQSICTIENMLKENRGPAIVSGKATLSPCREVQFNFLWLLQAALFYPLYFHFSYLPTNFFLEVLTAPGLYFIFSSYTLHLFSSADLYSCYTDCCICFSRIKCNL